MNFLHYSYKVYELYFKCHAAFSHNVTAFSTFWVSGAAAGTYCRTFTNGLTKIFTTESRLAADKIYIQKQFLLRIIFLSAFSGSMCQRFGQIVSPAVENTPSLGVEDAWTPMKRPWQSAFLFTCGTRRANQSTCEEEDSSLREIKSFTATRNIQSSTKADELFTRWVPRQCLFVWVQRLRFSPVWRCGTPSLLNPEAAHEEATHNQLSVNACLPARACVCLCARACVRACAAVGILKLLFSEQQTYQRVVCQRSPWQHTLLKKCIFIHNSEAYKVVLKALYCCRPSWCYFYVWLNVVFKYSGMQLALQV